MRVIYHNRSATKQRLHPQSVAEISRHSVLSVDRIYLLTYLLTARDKQQQCGYDVVGLARREI